MQEIGFPFLGSGSPPATPRFSKELPKGKDPESSRQSISQAGSITNLLGLEFLAISACPFLDGGKLSGRITPPVMRWRLNPRQHEPGTVFPFEAERHEG